MNNRPSIFIRWIKVSRNQNVTTKSTIRYFSCNKNKKNPSVIESKIIVHLYTVNWLNFILNLLSFAKTKNLSTTISFLVLKFFNLISCINPDFSLKIFLLNSKIFNVFLQSNSNFNGFFFHFFRSKKIKQNG